MIKKFENFGESKLSKVWYLELYDLQYSLVENDPLFIEIEEWVSDNDHNNGYAYSWKVGEDDTAYPLLDKYFINNGLIKDDIVIVHCLW